jgi:hypothetical protein
MNRISGYQLWKNEVVKTHKKQFINLSQRWSQLDKSTKNKYHEWANRLNNLDVSHDPHDDHNNRDSDKYDDNHEDNNEDYYDPS